MIDIKKEDKSGKHSFKESRVEFLHRIRIRKSIKIRIRIPSDNFKLLQRR